MLKMFSSQGGRARTAPLVLCSALLTLTNLATAQQQQGQQPRQQQPQQPQSPQQPQPRPTEPQTRPAPADPTRGAAQAASDQVVTITGCLKQEKDVPGLTPNPAERAGITEDYILTEVKMAASSKVSGLALSGMYEVEGIDEGELKKHLNHQVEVTGKIAGAPTAGLVGVRDATPASVAPTAQSTDVGRVVRRLGRAVS